jgi:hypothetical protein
LIIPLWADASDSWSKSVKVDEVRTLRARLAFAESSIIRRPDHDPVLRTPGVRELAWPTARAASKIRSWCPPEAGASLDLLIQLTC